MVPMTRITYILLKGKNMPDKIRHLYMCMFVWGWTINKIIERNNHYSIEIFSDSMKYKYNYRLEK